MKIRNALGALLASVLVVCSTSALAAGATNARVMTRNLYIGADVFNAINVPPAEIPFAAGEVLAEIIASDFPARAKLLAKEIADKQPHAVGLQEVWHVTGDPLIPGVGEPIDIDFLAILEAELKARGQKYDLVIKNPNLDLTLPTVALPVGPGQYIPYEGRIIDSDAILVRHNVGWSNVKGGNFAAAVPVEFDPPFDLLNFDILRGWTSVDLQFGGNAYRFVNTHLEVESFADGLFQTAQALELRATLSQLASEYGPLPEVVVGDFNSDPDDEPCFTPLCEFFGTAGLTPYLVLSSPLLEFVDPVFGPALSDAWYLRQNDRKSEGDTCCYEALAQQDSAGITRRVDQIWLRGTDANGVTVRLSGDNPKRQTPDGLYGSDHVGVMARMTLVPAY